MKTVVIYKSKTGFTKKYAEWIAKDLSADIFDTSKANINILNTYDTVIYGGSLYAVGIIGVKLITENMDKLKDKKLVVFATGASPWREEILDEIKNKNFTIEQQKSIRFFYLRGGFDFRKLNLLDRSLMTLLKLKIETKKELTSDEKSLLSMYDKPADFTMKKNIDELITYVNSSNTTLGMP